MPSAGLAPSIAKIAYRSYRVGDEEAIIAFLRECGYQPDLPFWRWINRGCPHGKTMIELALEGQRIVGHYALLPRRLRAGGATITAGQGIHAAVHPEFRGLAVLQGLMRRVVEAARAAGLPLLYAFPNAQIRPVYQKIFRWEDAGELVALERPVRLPVEGDGGGLAIVQRESIHFDERYRAFEDPESLAGLTHVVKEPAYLQWRYADHPTVRYQLLEASDAAGALAGYAILKRYEKNGTSYGHLIDHGVRDGNASMLRALVAAALVHFRRQQVERVSCWALPRTPGFDTIRAMGFQPTGFATPVSYRLLDPRAVAVSLNLEQWQLVMGDSDAF